MSQLLGRSSQIRAELARRRLIDFACYTMPIYRAGAVHRYMAAQLEAVEAAAGGGPGPRRLMLFLPPRTGKSEILIRFVAWALGRNPDWPIIYASYGADLAWEKSGEARAIVSSDEFAEVFGRLRAVGGGGPVELARDSRSAQRWRIAGRRGGLQAAGVGGPLTGKGGRLIIIDDPIKNREEADSPTYREKTWRWYTSTLRTRLEPAGAVILTMTRWHDDDLAGRLLELAAKDPSADQWTVISLPAIAEEAGDPLGRAPGQALDPARFDEDDLGATRASIGSRDWSALYMQRPQPDGGAIFHTEWFSRRPAPDRGTFARVIQAWDTAYEAATMADYSACVTIGIAEAEIHVLNVWRGRVEFPALLEAMKRERERWAPTEILIENTGSGKSARQTLKAQTLLPLLPAAAIGDKVARANLVTPICEAGKVNVPPVWWGDDLIDELIRFPAGAHDDQVDAFVYALARATRPARDVKSYRG